MRPIVRVEHLTKRYQIGQLHHDTLRDLVAAAFRRPFGISHNGAKQSSFIWAVNDISLEIAPGEVVGVIGFNGAGKSTLLKILSRVTEPTSGRVELFGRVNGLLEVGTGFHPELTGRENIYLNGSILGMGKREINRKFDEIVSFAETEKFLDMPLKFYSSGMYMRLAFAVAAHLQPEILIVDEVLSVGDTLFQKKCLGKIKSFAHEGRTVLFVSHNLAAVKQLCTRVLILSQGKAVFDGGPAAAVAEYYRQMGGTSQSVTFPQVPEKEMQILEMSVVSNSGEGISSHPHTLPFSLLVKYRISKWRIGTYVCVDVFDEHGNRLLWACDVTTVDEMCVDRLPGTYLARVVIPEMILAPGSYYFDTAIYAPGRSQVFDHKDHALSLEIVDGGSLLSTFGIKPHAATMIPLRWDTTRIEQG